MDSTRIGLGGMRAGPYLQPLRSTKYSIKRQMPGIIKEKMLSHCQLGYINGHISFQSKDYGRVVAQNVGHGYVEAILAESPGLLVGTGMNTLVYILGNRVLLSGLTWIGYFSSWVLGTLSYSAFGLYGFSIVCIYFVLGSAVTKVKLEQKQREGTAEARGGRRSLGSVLGSGIAGAACAVVALLMPETGVFTLMKVGFVASFASKLADTVSSEIGKAFGKTTYLATNLSLVPKGTEGAISLEGTLAGILAALCLSLVGYAVNMVDLKGLMCCIVGAFVANYLESILGATVQGKVSWLTNDVVNMIQISISSVIAIIMRQNYIF